MLFHRNYTNVQARIFVTLSANSHDLRPLFTACLSLLCARNHACHRELFALILSRHFYLFLKNLDFERALFTQEMDACGN